MCIRDRISQEIGQNTCRNVLRQTNKEDILRNESGEGPTPREGGRSCMAPEWEAKIDSLHLEIGGEMSELNVPVKGISRRSFLKTTAAVAGAAAVSGATMTALAATDEETATDDEHEVVCVCGCNCQGNCSMVATVREGKMVNILSLIHI